MHYQNVQVGHVQRGEQADELGQVVPLVVGRHHHGDTFAGHGPSPLVVRLYRCRPYPPYGVNLGITPACAGPAGIAGRGGRPQNRPRSCEQRGVAVSTGWRRRVGWALIGTVVLLGSTGVATAAPDKTTTQRNAPWGLARISHAKKGAKDYVYNAKAGEGVSVYVVGSGIKLDHREFQGRARSGHSVHGGVAKDATGGGTYAAGIVAGRTYGVAKKAELVAVRITDSKGQAGSEDLVKGLDWAITDAVGRPEQRSVILVTGSGEQDPALNKLVNDAYDKGVLVVAGAGMGKGDSCEYSPGSASKAMTVAATTQDDQKLKESTGGKCVKVLAPGKDIKSAGIKRPEMTNSGNLAAAAHVAGTAAYFLSVTPKPLTAKQLYAVILATARKDVLSGLEDGTPNRLLSNLNQ
ncbi:hypothetical protein D5S17_09680 [Pseudonocardiaceae bacterium YIM PH 21723]|nr:hypothetical protein D5S17_09680 [Pseudonocardiaceae bacterium YIM PH 21723]